MRLAKMQNAARRDAGSRRRWRLRTPLAALLLAFIATSAQAGLDLRNASRHTLENGLVVLVLEERSFPLVSVQMVYRAGARDETTGRTGLAHFVEHMAFRAAENFPDTGLVSSIYSAGGEWHGYTYIDQTTYFATVPALNLDLLLRIEADRMSRLKISADDIPAERGAVLAEMHGYENDPSAVLHDWSVFSSLVAHPYRNNTIGWESDVSAISRADVVDFYKRHYQPGNAVLAIVGDVRTAAVLRQVKNLFGAIPGRPATPLPITPEPPQSGERRFTLHGAVERKWFQMTWHAPAAADADYAAFLLMQELLSGTSGINFLHNDWGAPSRADTPLFGISSDISTWSMPTAQPYIFTIKGSIARDDKEQRVESAISAALLELRSASVDEERFEAARSRLLEQLALDVQTTEDAAHQLAFFSGIDAFDHLLRLPAEISALTPGDVQDIALRYLAPGKRTTGWSVFAAPGAKRPPASRTAVKVPPAPKNVSRPAPAPTASTLANGIRVILQPSRLSPTVNLQIVVPGAVSAALDDFESDMPIEGVSALNITVPAARLKVAGGDAARTLRNAAASALTTEASTDPYTRIEQVFTRMMGTPGPQAGTSPLLIVLAGDFDNAEAVRLLEANFTASAATAIRAFRGSRQALEDIAASRDRVRPGGTDHRPAARGRRAGPA
jgi:zinc protease